MALQNIPIIGPVLYPGLTFSGVAPAAPGNLDTLDASGEYSGFVFVATENMTISHVAFRTGSTATNSPTVEIRIETVDAATGYASGTLWNLNGTTGSPSATTGALSASSFNSSPYALTDPAIIVAGDVVAVKFLWGGVATSVVTTARANDFQFQHNLPYKIVNTGSDGKGVMLGFCAAVGSSATAFYKIPGVYPISGVTTVTANSTNTGAIALKFTVPFKCRARGLAAIINATHQDYSIVMYDSGGSELSSSLTAFDKDINASAARLMFIPFDNPVELAVSTTYYAAVVPTTASNVSISAYDMPSADYNEAMIGNGVAYISTRATSTWTDVTTRIPAIDVWIDQLDDGAGGGGGSPFGGGITGLHGINNGVVG